MIDGCNDMTQVMATKMPLGSPEILVSKCGHEPKEAEEPLHYGKFCPHTPTHGIVFEVCSTSEVIID